MTEWNTLIFINKQVVDKHLCWDKQTLKSHMPTEVLDTDSESMKLLLYTEFFVVYISSRYGVLLWPRGNQRGKDKTPREKVCKNEIFSKIRISRFRFKGCRALNLSAIKTVLMLKGKYPFTNLIQ